MADKKVYYGLDLLKFLLAILIIATHSNLFIEYFETYNIANILYTIAVPTFFAISTFLYCQKLFSTTMVHEAWSICKKDTIRLLWLCLFWVIVDIPMTYDTFWRIANWKEVVFGHLFCDPIRGIWFIKALIINKIILFLFRNHIKHLTIISLLLFIIFSLGYTPLLNNFANPLHPYFNFYFHLGFCCIGALFAKYEAIAKSRLDILSLLVVNVFIWHIFNNDYAVILWRIICPIFFINLFMKIGEPADSIKPLVLVMRKMSILLYFLHFNILWGLTKFDFFQDNSIIRFSITLVICIIISYSVLCLEKNKYLNFLKYSH